MGLLLLAVVVVCGCETTGLSVRETGSNTISHVIYSFPMKNMATTNREINKPIRLAVVQLGETAPSSLIINELKESNLFKSVISLPANSINQNNNRFSDGNGEIKSKQMDDKGYLATCQLAQQFGANYVLIYGGNIDSLVESGWASVLDMLTLGLIVPSQTIYLEGNALGALVDVSSHEIVQLYDVNDKLTGHAPSMIAASKQIRLHRQMRDRLLVKFSEKFIRKMSDNNYDNI